MPATALTRYAWLSIAAAIATIILKGVAWQMTGSVGLLSDAIESFVNLAGALMALWMLTLAALPADDDHAYEHGKAEYFSSAFEGFLILLAAFSIGYTAIERFMNPRPLEAVGIGLLVSVLASIINFATARILMRVGRERNSITLEADAHHLMTDVWTSAGVISGVGLVWFSGWLWLDPAIALLVAANIVWTGWQLMRRSADGLMDISLPNEKLAEIETVLLLARIYEAFPLACPICHAQMRIIAFINEAATVKKILEHIGESSQPPRTAPARGPPLWEAAESAGNDPQWDSSAQTAPKIEFDQRIAWTGWPGRNQDKPSLVRGGLAPVARTVAASGSFLGDRR